ncbi:MAG: Asp-tRNA(Asn)/Glu-tRNA(Gln) amidotransferase subunit GatA [Bacteroidota bacterium]|nr:Asp-tRNA(Asn)/Glu-tRNA(Gln) amidotransferase subunit GatA [Bacteroidota bacterium]
MAPLTYARTRRALKRGEITCVGVADGFLEVVRRENPRLNAFTHVDCDQVRHQASAVDEALGQGADLPLAGMVVALKDVLCTRDWPVTCSSGLLEGYAPTYDATAVARLRKAGAVFIGRANCDEFAMGSTNESSCYGPVRHPFCDGYVPGGSSGGSAAAVAAGMCHAAIGTDTGGSVRQPAAFCGVIGLKPTYGRVSRSGLIAYASSFDCIGTLTRSMEDAARIFKVMAGKDVRDATSAPGIRQPDTGRPLKIGLPKEYYGEGLAPEVRSMVRGLADDLSATEATTIPVSLPHTAYGVAAYYILAAAEASSNLARFDGVRYGRRARQSTSVDELYRVSRSEGFGFEVKRRIMLGTYVLSSGYYEAYYGKAQRVRTLLRQDFDRAFEQVDLLLTPITPVCGIRNGAWGDDPLQMYLSDIYTVTANLAGLPGLSVPIGWYAGGLPAAAQLLAAPFKERPLLEAGKIIMKMRNIAR